MIISRIEGGLGNQMFQYAAGLFLASKQGTPLKLDTSWYEINDARSFELHHFNQPASIATRSEVNEFHETILWSKIKRRLAKVNGVLYRRNYYPCTAGPKILKDSGSVDDTFPGLTGNIYLSGFWLWTHRWFDANILRRDFSPRIINSTDYQKSKQSIQSALSVSVHVRRGDYVNRPDYNQRYGTLDQEYYNHALELIQRAHPKVEAYIFTDDPEWVKGNLKLPPESTFISGQKLEAFEELSLMAACDHNIIANSTFSWWGAFLNPNANKMVICPKLWTRDNSLKSNDVLPRDWIRV